MSLRDAINPFFTDARDIAQLIAPVCAVLGMIGLGITYMGSSWPLIGDWRRDNPRVADQIIHTASCHFQHRLTQSAFSRTIIAIAYKFLARTYSEYMPRFPDRRT